MLHKSISTIVSTPALAFTALIIVTIAVAALLRWFVRLAPRQRQDVIELIKALWRR